MAVLELVGSKKGELLLEKYKGYNFDTEMYDYEYETLLAYERKVYRVWDSGRSVRFGIIEADPRDQKEIKKIFGECVKSVYYECDDVTKINFEEVEKYYIYEEDRQYDEWFIGPRGYLDIDGCNVYLLLADDRLVLITNSEWGSIELFKE